MLTYEIKLNGGTDIFLLGYQLLYGARSIRNSIVAFVPVVTRTCLVHCVLAFLKIAGASIYYPQCNGLWDLKIEYSTYSLRNYLGNDK